MAPSDRRTSSLWPIVTIVVAVISVVIAMPDSWKTKAPGFLSPSMRLGLDLAGGTQLDFRISEDEINAREQALQQEIDALKREGNSKDVLAKQFELRNVQTQHANLVEAIRLVLERRINSLGVSEATITPSFFGNEKHLLVECPGVIDVNKCIATVGKTIQLEFKEEYSGSTPDYEAKVRAQAEKVYRSVTTGTGSLQVFGQDLSSQLGVSYFDSRPVYLSSLPKGLEALANRTTKDPVLRSEATFQAATQDASGQATVRSVKGIYLTQVLADKKKATRPLTDPTAALAEIAATQKASYETKQQVLLTEAPKEYQDALKTMTIGTERVVTVGLSDSAILYLSGRTEGEQVMNASNIVIQYKGAERAAANVTRTKEEALQKITEIQKRLKAGEDFGAIARTESDGDSRKNGGSLGLIRHGTLDAAREAAAFALTKQGQISDIVESPYGFHIIRADSAPETSAPTVSYSLLRGKWDVATAQKYMDQVTKGEVTKADEEITIRGLFFSLEPTGWKDTDLNGRRFRSAAVTVDQMNTPVVQIQFDEEGGKLFQELTKNNVGKRIAIFVGGQLVSAPVVQKEIPGGNAIITGSRNFIEAKELAQDLNTGAIPAPIYLSGQSTIEATLGSSALTQSIVAAAIGLLILCLFMIIIYRVLGVMASLALILYVIILITAMKLPLMLVTKEHVVLTLAGIAGMILSMGMAVDANVLAFERIKEELRRGKMLSTAVDTGFRKAWPSVRDGNVSTLITCAILFTIGTSIIRGFAITLAMGIFISLFTAMVVSHWLCRQIAKTPMANRPELFGVKKSEMPQHLMNTGS
jgi:protein-export membrane protein SecD